MKHIFDKLRFYFIILIVNILSLLCGALLAWPLTNYPSKATLTSTEQTWILSLAYLGGALGPLSSGLIMEKVGRKYAVCSVYLPSIASSLLLAFGPQIWQMYISRILGGMGMFPGLSLLAVYLGEIAPEGTRGCIYYTAPLFTNLGGLLTFGTAPYMSQRDFGLVLFGVALVGFIGALLFIPESPYFLVQYGEAQKAREALELLRGAPALEEFTRIQAYASRPLKFCSKVSLRSLHISLELMAFQAFSGVSVVFRCAPRAFQEAGTALGEDMGLVLFGGAQLVSTFLPLFTLDVIGRKKVLSFASFNLSFTLGVLGIFFTFEDGTNEEVINWVPLVCFMLYFIFLNLGLQGVPFLYVSEILPLKVKAFGTSLGTSCYCLVGFIVTFLYDGVTSDLGFYVLAGVMMVLAFYAQVVLVETKGKKLSEVHARLRKTKRTKDVYTIKTVES